MITVFFLRLFLWDTFSIFTKPKRMENFDFGLDDKPKLRDSFEYHLPFYQKLFANRICAAEILAHLHHCGPGFKKSPGADRAQSPRTRFLRFWNRLMIAGVTGYSKITLT